MLEVEKLYEKIWDAENPAIMGFLVSFLQYLQSLSEIRAVYKFAGKMAFWRELGENSAFWREFGENRGHNLIELFAIDHLPLTILLGLVS